MNWGKSWFFAPLAASSLRRITYAWRPHFWTSEGSTGSHLICLATRGPYCHVSVDLGDGHGIGTHSEDSAQRRGFSYSIARETVRALWDETGGATSEEADADYPDKP